MTLQVYGAQHGATSSQCPSCHTGMSIERSLSCNHKFCETCAMAMMKHERQCSTCGVVTGIFFYNYVHINIKSIKLLHMAILNVLQYALK